MENLRKTVQTKVHRVSRRPLKWGLLLAVFGFLLMTVLLLWVFSQPRPSVSEQTVAGESSGNPGDEWWNKDYNYKVNVSVENQGNSILSAGTVVTFSLNHKELVDSGRSRPDGNDIRLVYLQNSAFVELDREVTNPGETSATVNFALNMPINMLSRDNQYYLYYGNESASNIEPRQLFPAKGSSLYTITLSAESGARFQVEMSRKWLLISSNPNINTDYLKMDYRVRINNYDALGKDVTLLISGPESLELPARSTGINVYSATIAAANLLPGTYSVQAVINGTHFKSSSSTFYVSYPLYVTWTIDYEGFDVSNANLAALAKVSEDYGMPVTHLFNPRIYIAGDIAKDRAKYLTDWVLRRYQENNDEIGLHLHMHLDMIKAAGLTPKTDPRWGGRTNGHDVLTSAYNYDEFSKILRWTRQQFADNGLPVASTYRSGGWNIGPENLRALADNGFLIDTSGREYFVWGSNNVKSPWHLLSTTRPYLVSANDMNSAAAPNLNLWEFPNNGLDSTNNKSAFLIGKFTDNYTQEPLTEAQTMTYMSHPHWFTTYDLPQLTALFKYTGQFKADQDQGPVVYLTLGDASVDWVK